MHQFRDCSSHPVAMSILFFLQVVLGVLVGAGLYCIIFKSSFLHHWLMSTSSIPLLLLSFFLLIGGMLIYWCLLLLQLDPAFSVQLAQRHCHNPAWVHLTTTPFFSLVRSSGSILGMSLVPRTGIRLEPKDFGTRIRLGALMVVGGMLGCLAHMSVNLTLLGSKTTVFYIESYLKAALIPLITIAPLAILWAAADVLRLVLRLNIHWTGKTFGAVRITSIHVAFCAHHITSNIDRITT